MEEGREEVKKETLEVSDRRNNKMSGWNLVLRFYRYFTANLTAWGIRRMRWRSDTTTKRQKRAGSWTASTTTCQAGKPNSSTRSRTQILPLSSVIILSLFVNVVPEGFGRVVIRFIQYLS